MIRPTHVRGAVAVSALLLAAACQDAPEPSGPSLPASSPQLGVTLPANADPDQRALARAIPGFGGLYLDADGVPTVHLTDPGQRPAAERVLAAFMAREGRGADQLRVRQGRFAYADLEHWHERAWPAVFAEGRAVVFTDVDEADNRVTIGVSDPSAAPAVRAIAARHGVPEEAVQVEVVEPIRQLVSLQGLNDPIRGGVQIHFPGFLCTLGFPAVSGSQASFITNSHCTTTQGGTEGTPYWQPLSSVDGTQVGTEVDDPVYFTGSGCPGGRQCRYSDSSRARQEPGRAFELGSIARTSGPNNGSLEVTGAFTITGTYAQSGVGQNCPVTGKVLNKMGRTTGWSQGQITNSCVNVGVSGTRIVQLSQVIVAANVAGGDSGSPVFGDISGSNVTLYGILWGGGSSTFVYSPFVNIEHELGPLTVTSGGGGPGNSAPEASFTATPTSGEAPLLVSFNASGSSDPDGDDLSYSWNFGDGSPTASGENVSHTFQDAGDFTVTLTVSDGLLSDQATRLIEVSEPTGGGGSDITLSVTGSKVRGVWTVDLSWSGATSTSVDIYRDGSFLTTTANDGAHQDESRGGAPTYQVCEAGTQTCSPQVTVSG